jgi:hypothetical protein
VRVVMTAFKSTMTKLRAIANGKAGSVKIDIWVFLELQLTSNKPDDDRIHLLMFSKSVNETHSFALTMTLGTFTVGLGISSQRCAPQSTPRYP